jgi:hypothetical protein
VYTKTKIRANQNYALKLRKNFTLLSAFDLVIILIGLKNIVVLSFLKRECERDLEKFQRVNHVQHALFRPSNVTESFCS